MEPTQISVRLQYVCPENERKSTTFNKKGTEWWNNQQCVVIDTTNEQSALWFECKPSRMPTIKETWLAKGIH